MTKEHKGYPRTERIRCPQCAHEQDAQVQWEKWMPFPSYLHYCEKCECIIAGSKREVVEEKKELEQYKSDANALPQFEVAKPDLIWKCRWAVYAHGSNQSLCYCTDRKRAQMIADALNMFANESRP